MSSISILFRKRNKLTSVNRLPSLYTETLIKSELDYRRELRRKMDQLQQDNRDAIRRRLANDHVFTHEHLAKRYQWFHSDKIYRDSCRTLWNKQTMEKNHSRSRFVLPPIYPKQPPTLAMKNLININENENSIFIDEQIKQKFLYTQPVMIEILNAPHSSQIMRSKQHLELRKKSAQIKQQRIQTNAMDDQRYRQLVFSLQET